MNLGSKLKLRRKKLGLTQIEFARKTNTSVATLRRWESGQTFPDASKLMTVAKALNIKPEEILQDDLPETPPIEPPKNDDNILIHKIEHSDKHEHLIQSNSNMLVLENKRDGLRYEIPPTEEGYKLFRELFLNVSRNPTPTFPERYLAASTDN